MNGQICKHTENEVISAALLRPRDLSLMVEYPEDIFYYSGNKTIYNTLKELYEEDKEIDSSVLTLRLKENGDFKKVEGELLELYKLHPPLSIKGHLESLFDKACGRDLMLNLKDAYNCVKTGDMNSDQFIQKVIEINSKKADFNKTEDITVADMSKMNLDVLFKSENSVPTGLNCLDEKMIGLRNGNLILIAARPGKGKTTLALQLIKNIRNGVLFFSLEMLKDELYLKLLSNDAEVDNNKIEQKKMNDSEYKKVLESHSSYSDYDITMIDDMFNIDEIIRKIKKKHKKNKLKVCFVDYVQLIRGGKGDTKNDRIGDISGRLKQLAAELKIPIVLLAQLNRAVDKDGREPVLSDLRDSGSLEQDGNVILFVHEKDGQTYLIKAKDRKGPTGSIKNIIFDKEISRFRDSVQTYNMADVDDMGYTHN